MERRIPFISNTWRSQAAPFSKRFSKRQTTTRNFTFVKNWDSPIQEQTGMGTVITQVSPRSQVIISSPLKQGGSKLPDVNSSPMAVPIVLQQIRSPVHKDHEKLPSQRTYIDPSEDNSMEQEEDSDNDSGNSVLAQITNTSVSDINDSLQATPHQLFNQQNSSIRNNSYHMDHSETQGKSHSPHTSDLKEQTITPEINPVTRQLSNSHVEDSAMSDVNSVTVEVDDIDYDNSDVDQEEESVTRDDEIIDHGIGNISGDDSNNQIDNEQTLEEKQVSRRSSSRGILKTRYVVEADVHLSGSPSKEAQKDADRPVGVMSSPNSSQSHIDHSMSHSTDNISIVNSNITLEEKNKSRQARIESDVEDMMGSEDTPHLQKKDKVARPKRVPKDRTLAAVINLWQGENHRGKSNAVDLDVVLNTIEDTLQEERDKQESHEAKKAVSSLCTYLSQGITDTIQKVERLRSLKKGMRESKSSIKELRENLIRQHQRKIKLSSKSADRKQMSKCLKIQQGIKNLQGFMRKTRELRTHQLTNYNDTVLLGYVPAL